MCEYSSAEKGNLKKHELKQHNKINNADDLTKTNHNENDNTLKNRLK